jgi:hypothetical protein
VGFAFFGLDRIPREIGDPVDRLGSADDGSGFLDSQSLYAHRPAKQWRGLAAFLDGTQSGVMPEQVHS